MAVEVSILRFTIRILRFDTIHMIKDADRHFVSVQRGIERIVADSFLYRDTYRIVRYKKIAIQQLVLQ
jgi:hypothetical protein